eukprot:SAG22_NODE_1818_length_3514_cov_10.657980_2_plen_122_part_00
MIQHFVGRGVPLLWTMLCVFVFFKLGLVPMEQPKDDDEGVEAAEKKGVRVPQHNEPLAPLCTDLRVVYTCMRRISRWYRASHWLGQIQGRCALVANCFCKYCCFGLRMAEARTKAKKDKKS